MRRSNPFHAASRRAALLAMLSLGATPGCTLFTSSGSGWAGGDSAKTDLRQVPDPPNMVRDAVAPRGLSSLKVEGVGMVNALPGSGGPANPSPYRDHLVSEMQRNDVDAPTQLLESSDNAMVYVSAVIPPGSRRGDPIDLNLSAPVEANASDLQSGWLLDTRMSVQKFIDGRIRKGDVSAIGTGAVLTRATIEGGQDERLRTMGFVLGGGTVQMDRRLGLVIRPEFQHVKISRDIAFAINQRFFFFDGSTRRGIATPVEDDFIELEIHPRYESALGRYFAVIGAVGVDVEQALQHERLEDLALRLEDPATAADAAIQLEALGESAIPTLLARISDPNPELRFYAAEALAYLDRSEAIGVLEEAVVNESAFRQPALTALSGMSQPAVAGSLERLFHQASIETRYGAFVALRTRGDALRVLTPQDIGNAFKLYQIDSDAPPAIAISTRRQPELVIFGTPSPLQVERFLRGPGGLIVKPSDQDPQKLRVSRFQVGQEDRLVVVNATLPGLVSGIVATGGGYGDVVAVLRMAKQKGYLKDQIAIDPLPKALRTYYRDEASDGGTGEFDEITGSGV